MHLKSTAVAAVLLGTQGTNANLNQLAKAAGKLYFGTATDNQQLQSDSSYAAILGNINEFGIITPANTMKWQYTEPSNGQFSYTQGDVVANFAESHGQMLRCHNLVWSGQLPNFIGSTQWNNASLIQVVQAHIASEVGHYKGKCYAWDVVNEAFNGDGSYVSDVFYQVIGKAYIPIAFAAAGQADPNAKLYYNDYNIETAGAKLSAALGLVSQIRAIGARIDGIGFESHFIVGQTPSASALTTAMNSVTALNLEVAVTELDVRFSSIPPSSSGLTQQANDYTGVVQACLNVARCVGVTVWDFDDAYSWVPSAFGGGDADLYWSNLTVKPAYNSITNLLKAHATSSGSPPPSSTSTSYVSTTSITTTTSTIQAPPTTTTTQVTTTTPPPNNGGGSQTEWGQCGGIGWGGATACQQPYACSTLNPYYAQCL